MLTQSGCVNIILILGLPRIQQYEGGGVVTRVVRKRRGGHVVVHSASMSTMTTDAPATAVREQRVAYVATEPAQPPKPAPAPQSPTLWRCGVAAYERR